jgi:hypothetical protein
MRGTVRPDGELILLTPAGPIDLLLEWDRGTETLDRLDKKLRRYRMAEYKLKYEDDEPRSILFVLPGPRRLENVRELCAALDREGSWPILATTAAELQTAGPLGRVWRRLDVDVPVRTLAELPARRDLGSLDPELALGRRWRHERPGFWERLSPLGRTAPGQAGVDLRRSAIDGFIDDPEAEKEGSWH